MSGVEEVGSWKPAVSSLTEKGMRSEEEVGSGQSAVGRKRHKELEKGCEGKASVYVVMNLYFCFNIYVAYCAYCG